MTEERLYNKAVQYLNMLCCNIGERSVGSRGNQEATLFFKTKLKNLGWDTRVTEFDAMDWKEDGATLRVGDKEFVVLPGPYSCGFKGEAELIAVSSVNELETADTNGKIILLHGGIAKEQLMPKNFVFYNPEEHQKIISLLEGSGARALISATGRNSSLAGGVYPFPLIEDGDFDIPSVYMTEEEGVKLTHHAGKYVFIESRSERIKGKGYNVIGNKGMKCAGRIVVTAHIDAKKGTPGAIDNATGIIVLLLLAELLRGYKGDRLIEIVALNGEDYYAVPGQMSYIAENQNNFPGMILNINIDGAGYKDGLTAFSPFSLPAGIKERLGEIFNDFEGITEGEQWPQGDHSIFLQFGVPAIAVSSKWFIDNINVQDITHTPKDNPAIVDCRKLVEISLAIEKLIRGI